MQSEWGWLESLLKVGGGAGLAAGVFFGSIRTDLKWIKAALRKLEGTVTALDGRVQKVDTRVTRLETADEERREAS